MSQPLRSDEILKAVKKLLPADGRVGKEQNFKLYVDDVFVGRVTIPKGSKSLAPKTYKSILEQAGVSDAHMRETAACRWSRAEYENAIRTRSAASAGGE